jgi:transaldolase
MMFDLQSLNVQLFADGADLADMIQMAQKPFIAGLTTNPTLMKKSGVLDYAKFAQEAIKEIPNKPISFEVFSDDLDEMKEQALKISSWGENVFVKIPITNTKGEVTTGIISDIVKLGVKVNVTAIMTLSQVSQVARVLDPNVESCVSVFAGRIADTGVDPVPTMAKSLELLKPNSKAKLIWASPRELLNIFQANEIGCHIITATSEVLGKLTLVGYNLDEYSLDTVKMFHRDALNAGFSL